MARHLFIPPSPAYSSVPSGSHTLAARSNVSTLRDAMRTGWLSYPSFNTALPSGRWKLSDIGQTTSGGADPRGYYFIARDTLHGLEYLFVFPGTEAASNFGEMTDYWGTFSDWYTYVQPVTSAPVTATTGTGQGTIDIIVYQNPDYATSSFARAFGFDDTTNLTYIAGDFQTVTTDPLSTSAVVNDWLPVSGVDYVRGFSFKADDERFSYAIMIDDVEDALWMWAFRSVTATGPPAVDSMCCLSTKMFVPNEPGDTYLQGGLWVEISNTGTQVFTQSQAWAQGFDAAGNYIYNYALKTRRMFSVYARRDADLYRWRNTPVVCDAFDKGWINSTLLREMGADQAWTLTGLGDIRELFQAPSSELPMIRYTGTLANSWKSDLPAFPFPFPEWSRVDPGVVTSPLPSDAIIMFGPGSEKFQDSGGTTPATAHGHTVQRINNEGTLGGYYDISFGTPTLALGVLGANCVYFNGSARLAFPDNDALTIVSGQGFESYWVILHSDTNTNRGVAGKWGAGGSQAEWGVFTRSSTSPFSSGWGVFGYYSGDSGGTFQTNDGNPHVLAGRHTTGNLVITSVDGTDINAGTSVGAYPSNQGKPLYLGAYDDSNVTNMTGYVAEGWVFDRALSSSERNALFAHWTATYGI